MKRVRQNKGVGGPGFPTARRMSKPKPEFLQVFYAVYLLLVLPLIAEIEELVRAEAYSGQRRLQKPESYMSKAQAHCNFLEPFVITVTGSREGRKLYR